MDAMQFHILLSLVPERIGYAVLTWIINTHLLPKVENLFETASSYKQLPRVDNLQEQATVLYNTYFEMEQDLVNKLKLLMQASENGLIQETQAIQDGRILFKQAQSINCVSGILRILGPKTEDSTLIHGIKNSSISIYLTQGLGLEHLSNEVVDIMYGELTRLCKAQDIDLQPYIDKSSKLKSEEILNS